MTRVPGQVFGTAGGSLTGDVGWAQNADVARIGRGGERRTGAILDALAREPGGPTVLHDLRIPIPGFNANIDHAVVSGDTVTLLDSKVWKPGFYWTVSGRTRRGLELFPPADKRTLPTAVTGLRQYLLQQRLFARFATPHLVVWPSNSQRPFRVWALRPADATAVRGDVFERRPARVVGSRPADPSLVSALALLVN